MIDRRTFFKHGFGVGLSGIAPSAYPSDKWGADQGYPTGWAGQFSINPIYRVGNYSGGFERMLPHRKIQSSTYPRPLSESAQLSPSYQWKSSPRTVDDYLNTWSTTGLLICRDSKVLFERYLHDRTSKMRMTSWSMAKSVTSLLLGICLDRGLISSYDDTAEKYVPELVGTLHGSITFRNLSNMSSGADILHDRDNRKIYPSAFLTKSSNISGTVTGWNTKREEQGTKFNYNELCPLTIGMVIRQVTGMTLSDFLHTALWQPIGAENLATWTTDSYGNEFNCIGFAATLRDWAKIGVLLSNRGAVDDKRVISEAWFHEVTSWSDKDRQVRFGVPSPKFGYKALMWHNKPDGSRFYFNGHHGQRLIVDLPTKTVLVHTAVDTDGDWEAELFALFEAATRL